MKQLKLIAIALITLASFNVSAQDADNPWVIGFGINTVDVERLNGSGIGDFLEDFVGTREWPANTIPSISRISMDRYLNKGFSFQLAGTINKIGTFIAVDDADALYFSIDALFKYDVNKIIGDTGWFDPYIGLGGGYQSVDIKSNLFQNKSAVVLTGAIGFNAWFNKSLGLNYQSAYKGNFGGTNVFQHSLGLVFRFGGKDTDGDGIYDDKDACPEVAGLKEFNGCPDADGDGIQDGDDACPNVSGLASMNGCPDGDGDGVADKDDMCPNSKGTKANKGCPDTDGDGVVDKYDKCVSVVGPAGNSGCPWPDGDGDGVLDKDDECPTVAGVPSEAGCPEKVIIDDAVNAINFAAKTILFNTGRASFKPGITRKLDAIADIMIKYPKATFAIGGHTDSSGRADSNLRLSEKRAIAVRDYLVRKGITSSRLEAAGYGEGFPIDTNKTRDGRSNNRRVEIKVTN
ncbi:MAG: OmpA family protein [Polaribacter sp.]